MLPCSRILAIASAVLLLSCSDKPSGPVSPSMPTSSAAPASANLSDMDLALRGDGTTIESTMQTPHGEIRSTRSVIGASPGDVPVGVRRDMTFQLAFDGFPRLGDYALAPQSLQVKYANGIPFLVTGNMTESGGTLGNPDVVLFIWPEGAPVPTRELVLSEPGKLTITEYVAPDLQGSNGRAAGVVAFTADEWVREGVPGAMTIRKSGDKVHVRAQLSLTWQHRVEHVGR